MAGTANGAAKTRDKLIAINPNHYKEIGSKGGKAPTTGGFFADRELASRAGKKGGSISRRRRKGETDEQYKARTQAVRSELS